MKNLNFTYLEEENLLIERYCGALNLKDVIQFKNEIARKLADKSDIKFFIDVRDENSLFEMSKMDESIEYFKKSSHLNQIHRMAILTNTPDQVVKASLFQEGVQISNTQFQIFSSISAALKWLSIYIDESDFEDILARLKKQMAA